MGDHLTIDIPSSAITRYVIVTDEDVGDAEQFAGDRLTVTSPAAQPSGAGAKDLIGSPALRIRPLPADESPLREDLGRIAVLDEAEHDRLVAAGRHLIIDSELPTERQPLLAQQVRSVARQLAATTEGMLVDWETAQLIPPDRRVDGERGWFCLADRWLGFDVLINPDSGAEGPPTDCSCLCLFTRGLARFGLPDLVIDEVACAHDLSATNLLRGLAVHLLTRLWNNPHTGPLHVDDTLVITPEHVWAYWAARPLFGGPVAIRIAPSGRTGLPEGRHLEILPHPDFAGTRVEWGNHILGPAMPQVAGWQPDDPPYRIDRPTPPT